MAEDKTDILVLAGEIVSAYVSNNSLRAEELPNLIRTVRATLVEEAAPKPEPEAQPEHAKATPAQVRKSIQSEALISFIDGKPYKTLKRHLSRHGLTVQEYKQRYGLPKDYPSVAPDYSARRSEMAKSLGLGARRRGGGATPAEGPAPAALKRGGRRKPAEIHTARRIG